MTALIPKTEFVPSKYGTQQELAKVTTPVSWIPYLRLFGSGTDLVKKGKIPMAHYGLVINKDEVVDLGNQVDILPISWRPKAMRFGKDSPVSYFNPSSDEFIKVQENSKVKDSGCTFGPEFLVYIPKVGKFATLYLGNESGRRIGDEFAAMIGSGVTLNAKLVEWYDKKAKQDRSWHAVQPVLCQQPFDVPPMEEISKVRDNFNNPEESSIEFDPEKLEGEEPRAR